LRFVGLPQRVKLPQAWLGEPVVAEVDGERASCCSAPNPCWRASGLRLRLGEQRLRPSAATG
jgi:hypothetical protein